MSDPMNSTMGTNGRGAYQLLLGVLCIVLMWRYGWPWLGTLPAMEAHRAVVEERDIHVGAIYYTDLEWYPGERQ